MEPPAASAQHQKPLSAEALAKREARARRREEEAQQAKAEKEQEQDMWENTYAFSTFSLKVQEEFGGESCVGGTQWPGGVRVARYLDNALVFPPGALRGKTLIDLGSGCGLVAAVAAKHGARVLAVDKQIVMQVLTDNMRTNGVLVEPEEAAALRAEAAPAEAGAAGERCYLPPGRVVAEELLWGPGVSHPVAPFDICIAAACLYMPKTVPLLLDTLHALSDDKSLIILAAIIGQNTLEHFLEVRQGGRSRIRVDQSIQCAHARQSPSPTNVHTHPTSHTHPSTHAPQVCGQWFEYEAHRDEDGGVIGSSWEGNLSKLDVATRILILKRKDKTMEGNGASSSS